MASSPASPLMRDLSGRRLGRYEVLIQLASGGMATVYVARAQGVAGFERLVAVKVLHPHLAHDEEFISMFLDEARLAARIRHPNVVPTLDISDTQGDGFFLVMEYIEGDHLGSLLREAARAKVGIPPAVAARLVIDALEGLGAAHTLHDADGNPLGLVHRDVSPHNVLVGADGAARITDFGVAKAEVRLSSTRDGQFKGKLSYMAPEQASSGKADQRSDLFSMGIVLWETLTGRRLFRADNNGELLNRLLNDPIPAPSAHAPEAAPFDEVCARALARKPEDRFQTAEDFVVAIERAAQPVGGPASQRVVGKLVRELLGSKVQGQNARIREAIDALGRSQLKPGLLPLPEGGGSQPSQPSKAALSPSMTPSAVRPIAGEDMTLGAKPSTVQLETASPAEVGASGGTKRTVAIVAVACALLLIAIGVAAMGLGGGAAPQADATAPAPPTASRPAAEVGDPEPARVDPATAEAETGSTDEAAAAAPGGDDDESAVAAAEARPEAGATEAADEVTATDDDDGADEASPEARPRSRRSRRHRDRRDPATTEGATGGGGAREDDDLLVNPYRR